MPDSQPLGRSVNVLDDETQLERHGLPWAALQDFVDGTDWKDIDPSGPDREMDRLALAIGISIGWIAARNHQEVPDA